MILAERRAKLAQLRGELYVHDRDITSAPSLTVVDEFQEDFSSADRRSGLVDGEKPGHIDEHKIFYAERNGRKESDFEFKTKLSKLLFFRKMVYNQIAFINHSLCHKQLLSHTAHRRRQLAIRRST